MMKSPAILCAVAVYFGAKQKSIDSIKSFDSTFLSVNLPILGKAFDAALNTGKFILPHGFKASGKTSLPRFLYEFFILVFDKYGFIRDRNIIDYQAIRHIRQLLYLFYKFESEFSDEQRALAYMKFRDVDKLVKNDFTIEQIQQLESTFHSLFPAYTCDFRPMHSNGATSLKYDNVTRKYGKSLYPVTQGMTHLFFNSLDHAKRAKPIDATYSKLPISRFTLVPKDSRGPRGICIEPHENMFVQQGIMQSLYEFIEKYSPAKGRINFSNQDVNRRLAYTSSIDRAYCTIDLKDASDLVSYNLISELCPLDWWPIINMTRSGIADVDGELIRLNKFAPMGSALCFPIEAMLFYSICHTVTPDVYVYGDDIIVPNDLFGAVVDRLESYGLIVNVDKSLHLGFFRESCGSEYYNGHDISYVKAKSYALDAFIPFLNQIGSSYGYDLSDQLAHLFEETTGEILHRSLPGTDSPLTLHSYRLASSDVFFRRQWSTDYQCWLVRRKMPAIKKLESKHAKRIEIDPDCAEYDDFYLWLLSKANALAPAEYDRYRKILHDVQLGELYTIVGRSDIYRFSDPIEATRDRLSIPVIKYTWVSA